MKKFRLALSLCALCVACTVAPGPSAVRVPADPLRTSAEQFLLLNRLTWGANASAVKELAESGVDGWLERQLRPPPGDDLPPEAQAQVAAMVIAQRPIAVLVAEVYERRKTLRVTGDESQKKMEQQAFQRDLTRLAREAAARSVLRALYSPWQVREQMTWFWMNHFSVFQFKGEVRALVGDYEENAIRPHALGRFRDLLGAVTRHPAMLRYLDNAQNASGRVNENYARELMELHTLGIEGGYSQRDVQELARVLTGLGIVNPELDGRPRHREYVRAGMFEFAPARHDYGAKTLLGEPVRARGYAELDEALDRLARHPSTARFVSHKLALYFVADEPPPELVKRMAATFRESDGNIARVLETLLHSAEFRDSLNKKFKDPMHYVISAVRLAYDGKTILNPEPILGWLARMGEPLYGRPTPDGYPMTQTAWASPGQMATRFEVARILGYGAAGLFRERPAFPQLANSVYYASMQELLDSPTHRTLDKAGSSQEWNFLLLASPEFMQR
jgi:uncharacterized protein (DUF1800 family)